MEWHKRLYKPYCCFSVFTSEAWMMLKYTDRISSLPAVKMLMPYSITSCRYYQRQMQQRIINRWWGLLPFGDMALWWTKPYLILVKIQPDWTNNLHLFTTKVLFLAKEPRLWIKSCTACFIRLPEHAISKDQWRARLYQLPWRLE